MSHFSLLILKRLGGEGGGGGGGGGRWGQFDPSFGFSENISSKETKERVKLCFFVTFNIILKYIFPENFIDFLQVIQKI